MYICVFTVKQSSLVSVNWKITIMTPFMHMKVGQQNAHLVLNIIFQMRYCRPTDPIRCPFCPYTCDNRVLLSRHQTKSLRDKSHSQRGLQSRFVPIDYFVCDHCSFFSKRQLSVVGHCLRAHRIEVCLGLNDFVNL